ncbi:hypothetical protein, partial [Burkholderia pseudomallei]|uniref:hypothetical protein n=1 Tax=Burkholderia pseudomallei TaxID=28450 RepID=UPI0021561D5B
MRTAHVELPAREHEPQDRKKRAIRLLGQPHGGHTRAALRAHQHAQRRHEARFADARLADDERRAPRRATLVVGEPGIGESRLVPALRVLVRAQRGPGVASVWLPEQANRALFAILRFVLARWQLDVGGAHAPARMPAAVGGGRACARATAARW